MGDTFNCGIVGYAKDITYVRLEPNKTEGPFWHQILPWVRGRHLVWDLTHKDLKPAQVVQDIALLGGVLQKKKVLLWLRGISPDIARSLSSQKVPLPNVTCLDLEAPYFCAVCSSLSALTINLDPSLHKKLIKGLGFPQAPPCPTCKSEMRFNDIPRQFFSFLKKMRSARGDFLDPANVNIAFNDAELSRAGGASHLDKKLWWFGNPNAPNGPNGKSNTPTNLMIDSWITITLLITNVALIGALLGRLL